LENLIVVSPRPQEGAPDETSFIADLREMSQNPAWKGDLIFDFLYYPRFQDITCLLNGAPIDLNKAEIWRQNPAGAEGQAILAPPVHNLKVSGLPRVGVLELKVRFIGSRAGNLCSVIAAVALAFLVARAFWRNRAKAVSI
jgi:hypothetical protein